MSTYSQLTFPLKSFPTPRKPKGEPFKAKLETAVFRNLFPFCGALNNNSSCCFDKLKKDPVFRIFRSLFRATSGMEWNHSGIYFILFYLFIFFVVVVVFLFCFLTKSQQLNHFMVKKMSY